MASIVLENSPYREIVNKRMQRAFEAGLINKWIKNELKVITVRHPQLDDTKPLTLWHFVGPFISISSTYIVSVLIFICELRFGKNRNKTQ